MGPQDLLVQLLVNKSDRVVDGQGKSRSQCWAQARMPGASHVSVSRHTGDLPDPHRAFDPASTVISVASGICLHRHGIALVGSLHLGTMRVLVYPSAVCVVRVLMMVFERVVRFLSPLRAAY